MMQKNGIRGCSGDKYNSTIFHLVQKGSLQNISTVDSPYMNLLATVSVFTVVSTKFFMPTCDNSILESTYSNVSLISLNLIDF
jgi:hypothetical protein